LQVKSGSNILSFKLVSAMIGLVSAAGLLVLILLSGMYHDQVMEAHIEEIFYLAEHNLEDHQSGQSDTSAHPGFAFALEIDDGALLWSGEAALRKEVEGREPVRWQAALLPQIAMALKAALGLEDAPAFLRVNSEDLQHDHLHGRPGKIGEVIAVFPANFMQESMNHFFLRGVALVLAVAFGVGLPFALVVKRQVISPLNQLIHDIAIYSKNLYSPQGQKRLSPEGTIMADAEQALYALQQITRDELVQRDKLASVGEAVTKINHDMRNILTSAMLLSDNLKESDDPAVSEAAPVMINAIERAVDFCNQILAYLKTQGAPDLSATDLSHIFNEIGIGCNVLLSYSGPQRMLVDSRQFFRLIDNLVANAEKAGADRVSITASQSGHMVVVDVADNGPGINPEAREFLFKPFQGDRGKTGLGLAIARDIALGHGGDLRLNSTSSDGSVFRIILRTEVLEDQA